MGSTLHKVPLLGDGGGLTTTQGGGNGNTKNNLNVINGCYVPCLLNILGAVLFLRIGFSVGMMGLYGTLGIFAFSEGVAYLTISSFSAIATQGKMAGGGAYYMISRNLGPAFGASSGLLFWFTYCINVTFNCVAFTETFMPTYLPAYNQGPHKRRNNIICSTVTLFVLFLIAFKGAGTFAKVNYFIFAGLMVSLAVTIGTVLDPFGRTPKQLETFDLNGHNYTGMLYPISWHAPVPGWTAGAPCPGVLQDAGCYYGMKTNLYPDPVASSQCGGTCTSCTGSACTPAAPAGVTRSDCKDIEVCTLSAVFAIVFPAVCGMMEGLNLSGDLRNPAFAIPWGSIAAVTTAFVFYVCLIVGQAGTMNKAALQQDMSVMQHACVNQYFVVLGVATACLSTSLGSMFGSARIIQAIARDDIIPFLEPLGKGSAKGNEPRLAVTLTYAISQAAIFIGGLDKVAPVLTNFFLITYALTNLACFMLEISKVANFKPTWRYYSWQTSLFGSILVTVTMFYLNVLYGVVTMAVVAVIFVYVQKTCKPKPWFDVYQHLGW